MTALAEPSNTEKISDRLLILLDQFSRESVRAVAQEVHASHGVSLLMEYDMNIKDLFGVQLIPCLVELDTAWRFAGFSHPSSLDDIWVYIANADGLDKTA